MGINRYLLKINRICAWFLLAFMIIFLISGYAWSNRIILPLQQARYLHTELDIYLVIFFPFHVLISTKFTLTRWRISHSRMVNIVLIIVGVASFWLVLSIR